MDTVLGAITIVGAVVGALMWIVHTARHRRHLEQCVQDLQRQRRLDLRLVGCVTEMERMLDVLPAHTAEETVPEELAGHTRYLFGLRREAEDNAWQLSRHAVRLRWPDGYLARTTLAGKRCTLAHGALVTAFQALADATREYERGVAAALLRSGDGAQARALSMPLRMLDESSAAEVARLREVCERALTHAADACNLRVRSHTVFDTTWPARRSEVLSGESDPYQGEIKPMSWTGFGPQPLLHVDAR